MWKLSLCLLLVLGIQNWWPLLEGLQVLKAFPDKMNSTLTLKPHLFYATDVLCLFDTALNSNISQQLFISLVTRGWVVALCCWRDFFSLRLFNGSNKGSEAPAHMVWDGILGNTYFSLLCLLVDSDIGFGVWVLVFGWVLPPHSFISAG